MKEINSSNFDPAQYDAVVLDIFADWCMPCKALQPVLEKIANEMPEVTFLKIDADSNHEFLQKYNVQAIPTLLFFKSGSLIKKTTGIQTERDIKNIITNLDS